MNDSGVAVPSRDLALKYPLGALRFARLISRTHQALDGRKDLLSQENIAEARELAGRWLPLVNPTLRARPEPVARSLDSIEGASATELRKRFFGVLGDKG